MLQRICALQRMQPPVVDNRGLLFGSGADYPTLGDDGWQTGAIWLNTSGSTGTSLYVNEGSVTSCNFVPVDTSAGASTGAIDFDDNITGPLISIETTTPTNASYTTPFLITGAYSSSADNALVLSATNTRPVSFLFEDSGSVLGAADYRAGLFRVLLTVDQTAAITLNALRAQIKANNEVDITSANAVVAPFTGYLELDGAGARTLNGHVACVRAALETGAGAHTLGSRLAGFESTLNSSGTFTAAKLFAYTANISGGTTKWQFGYKVEDSSCDTGFGVGTCTTGLAMLGVLTTGIIMTGVTAYAIDIATSGYIRQGVQDTAISLNNTYPYGIEVQTITSTDFAQPDTGVSAGIYSRYEMGFDQVTATGHAAVFAKLRVKKDLADGVHAAAYNYVEISGGAATVIGGTATTQTVACHCSVETDSGFELSTGHLNGIVVDSSIHATGTFTGTISGIRIKKSGSAKAWPVGIAIEDSACETAIDIGSCTTGIDFTGTYTGNAIDFTDATIDANGSNGRCFIRLGTHGTSYDYGADNDQSGVIRLYTECSGDGSSYDRGVFVCTRTLGAKGAFPIAGLAEANNTGTGPQKLQAAQFIAHLGADNSASQIPAIDNIAGGATGGMYGVWAKVCAGTGGCICAADSRVAPLWVDNQMNGTVSGEEYAIFASTGCSRPDGFIGFETTSSGYSQLFYFDETFNSGAGTCITTDAAPTGGTQDARILVWYDGKQYYLALYR